MTQRKTDGAGHAGGAAAERFIGIDVGAETLKLVELVRQGGVLRWTRRRLEAHRKDPGAMLLAALRDWDWGTVRAAAVSGRLGRLADLLRVPTQQAQSSGYRFLRPRTAATVVSIGSRGFSVLELRPGGRDDFRENSRCAQGTGNFLRQLVERFELSVEEASLLCEDVPDPAPLSGRCPVILKTDMTHLANKGESRARILAGLYDAVCENVQALIKPKSSPPRVSLIGGVSRSGRIRRNLGRFLAQHGMELSVWDPGEALFLEALGSALIAAERGPHPPPLDGLLKPRTRGELELLPPLAESLGRVRRMARPPAPAGGAAPSALVLGVDVGSTGSKAMALDARTGAPVWESYVGTNGDPVGAAQILVRAFLRGPAGSLPVRLAGVTGSGREIVGSLLATCFGREQVYVLNEIAAHAEGALRCDPRVDTIFEIGGQDAKYIRLAGGRVVDAAMNEACSAGTGSFIEEQGRKFAGVPDVAALGREALAADSTASLGQHCSVFMAEVLDEGVAAGAPRRALIAGLYDSVIQNYLNRVKGSRSVGSVVFCQGMPFSADALAAAVARQTGSLVVVPPSPGMMGALGIALLALKQVGVQGRGVLDLERFLGAKVAAKDTFVCAATRGCGGSGNKCRIDRLETVVGGERRRFTWGGGCCLHDQGTRTRKLPDLAPDPFREREELVARLMARCARPRGLRRVALTDEFVLKGLFPFFAAYLTELGFDLEFRTGADQRVLKRGIEESNVPFCAPMQLYHGLAREMAEGAPDFIFLPMLRSLPRVAGERVATTCPIVQGSADILRWDLDQGWGPKLLLPVIDMGRAGLDSREFRASCARIAAELGVPGGRWRRAWQAGRDAQEEFEARCLELGRRALEFCARQQVVPVVVLGRAYTIYNRLLNSNVPAILREQGAVAIPVDCYPVAQTVPAFRSVYWGYAQRNLRAARQIRLSPGVYSLFCSNYSCGPDSFSLHFYAYLMEGKPYAVIETDGHSGDAGTKTRVEAFLHCVREDLDRRDGPAHARPASFHDVELRRKTVQSIRRGGETVLIPRLGPSTEALAAVLRGVGLDAEVLPEPDRESVRLGRRHTSGKECLPMCLTLGDLLQRLERERGTDRRFAFLMPTSCGPCRFGVYNELHKIVLERLGWKERVGIWSPNDSAYFNEGGGAFKVLAFTGIAACDLLTEALLEVRPVEKRPGAAREIWERARRELCERLEAASRRRLPLSLALMNVANGRLFGCSGLLARAAAEFAAVKGRRALPCVGVVGEIYVRLNPFANDSLVDKLEARGLRTLVAPAAEWFAYTEYLGRRQGGRAGLAARLSYRVLRRVQNRTRAVMARKLGWHGPALAIEDQLAAAAAYVRPELEGEAALTVGTALAEWRAGRIHGVIAAGPLECMPNKVAQAQLFHAARREGLPTLTLALNGDALDDEGLENFVFEVWGRFRRT